jgi:hypothetical protein
MRPRLPLILLFMAVPLWLAASYGLRYGLMEDPQWVGTCVTEATRWECQLRANLGLLIHFRVLGWAPLPRRWWLFLCAAVLAVRWRCWPWSSGCQHWRCITPVSLCLPW